MSRAGLGAELIKASAFFLKSWRVTRRNPITVFEVVFWPVVGLLSVGLMTTFLRLGAEATLFVLTGTIAFSVVHVCQIDVAYSVLFDMWAKSVKHQFVAPVRPWHMVAGTWLLGVIRGVSVFTLLTVVSRWVFGVRFLDAGWTGVAGFLLGLLLSAAAVGLVVSALLLLFGVHAEVTAWSGVSLVLLVCGIYYPISMLPAPLAAMAAAIPLSYFLEAFRAHFGFTPVLAAPFYRGLLIAVAYVAGGYALFSAAIARSRRTGMLLRMSD
jgi:ABC-2 type transport system permease protein